MRWFVTGICLCIAACQGSSKKKHLPKFADSIAADSVVNTGIRDNGSQDGNNGYNGVGYLTGTFGGEKVSFNFNYEGVRYLIGNFTVGTETHKVIGEWVMEKDSSLSVNLRETSASGVVGEIRMNKPHHDTSFVGEWKSVGDNPPTIKTIRVHHWRYSASAEDILTSINVFYVFNDFNKAYSSNYRIYFEDNHTVKLEYYENFNDDNAQMIHGKGTWKYDNDLLSINLDENYFFNGKAQLFTIESEQDESAAYKHHWLKPVSDTLKLRPARFDY